MNAPYRVNSSTQMQNSNKNLRLVLIWESCFEWWSIVYAAIDCTIKNGTFATLEMLQTQDVDVIFGPICSTGKLGRRRNIKVFIKYIKQQEAFAKCWAHSPLRAAARPNFTLPFTRCRYCRMPPLLHAACASMSTTTTTTRDRGDHYSPIEWAQ